MSMSLLNLDNIVKLINYEQLKHKIVNVHFSSMSKQGFKALSHRRCSGSDCHKMVEKGLHQGWSMTCLHSQGKHQLSQTYPSLVFVGMTIPNSHHSSRQPEQRNSSWFSCHTSPRQWSHQSMHCHAWWLVVRLRQKQDHSLDASWWCWNVLQMNMLNTSQHNGGQEWIMCVFGSDSMFSHRSSSAAVPSIILLARTNWTSVFLQCLTAILAKDSASDAQSPVRFASQTCCFTSPPIPSTAPLPCDVAKKFHVIETSCTDLLEESEVCEHVFLLKLAAGTMRKKVDLLNCWMLRFQILENFAEKATDSQFTMYHVITYNDRGFSGVTVYPSADCKWTVSLANGSSEHFGSRLDQWPCNSLQNQFEPRCCAH